MPRKKINLFLSGFTLVEILIVIAIIGILANLVVGEIISVREATLKTRTDAEFRQFATALEKYKTDHGGFPDDVNRNIPPGLEAYLSTDDWPEAPWPNSVYDWDAWTINGEDVYQLSVRFCPQGGPLAECSFPDQEWAENFGVNSAYFYCFEGSCRSHSNEPADYPGYCANCECKQMETC